MTPLGWSTIWAIARRDLRGRFRGLRLLLVCLFLGVATLAAIGSLTASITGELDARGQTLLGGDIEAELNQRTATDSEKSVLAELGQVSETVRMQAMANRTSTVQSGPQAVLVELKGVDEPYPLYGTLMLENGPADELAVDEAFIGSALVDRLRLAPGDTVRFGSANFTIAGIIADEPDRLSEGFTLGPVALVSNEGLARTGLIQPGSMYETKYRVRLPAGSDPAVAIDRLESSNPDVGWDTKDRSRAAGGASRFIERMGQFLTLVGLAALLIAGIGVGNGVASYLGTKRQAIATLKILGAGSNDILRIYLVQVFAAAALAVVAGLVVGVLATPVIVALAGEVLPVSPGFSIHPVPLLVSALYGFLIAIIFALPPLLRARQIPAAAMFRTIVERARLPGRLALAVTGGGILAVAAIAIGTARDPFFSASFLGASAGVFVLLAAIGWGVRRGAAHLPKPKRPLLRLALANLHRPGAQTGQLVIALGLGLTLFVTLAAIQTSLDNEIETTVPQQAPNLFVLDVPVEEAERFNEIVTQAAPEAAINTVPALRGTITAYRDVRVAQLEELPENAWVLRGDRGLTYSETLPEGSELTAGQWWPVGYSGPPLVSIDVEMANALDLAIGDPLTVNLLGAEITAKVSSLRRINWDTMGFNYVMVFSPNTLRDAPHNLAATISMDPVSEGAVSRALLAVFPSISVIEVREVIGQVRTILGQMSAAISAAASIAVLSGIAVLIGAIAAARQSRTYDGVVMKTLGATRRQILWVQALEFGLLAMLLAGVALAIGLLAAWFVIVHIFEFSWLPGWATIFATLGAGAALTLGIGLLGSLPVLSVRPAKALREL